MSPSSHSPLARGHKSTPCRLYSKGHCRFGDKCWFSHDAVGVQPLSPPVGVDTHFDQLVHILPQQSHEHPPSVSSASPSHETSDARPRPKRGEIPCRAWKAGTCTKGSKCWFNHDIDVQKLGFEPLISHKQKSSLPVPLQTEENPAAAASSRAERTLQEADLIREQKAEAAMAARERENAISREEASKTISQLVYGSIVTYSAGLDVPNLITGFETCTLRVRNLPSDVKEDDIHALLRDHGVEVHQFHFAIKKKSGLVEALVVTDIVTGRALAARLDGVELQDETLVVEMTAANSLDGMNAATGQGSETLTISWRAPSACYIAEYIDIAAANAKVKELDRLIHGSRRIKVEMNTQPRGRFVPNLRLNAIRINNLPPSITNQDVIMFTGALSVKRLPAGGPFGTVYTAEQIARLVQVEIERAVPGGLNKFDNPPSTCPMDGVVFARAHFSSWDEAHTAYTRLSDKRYGNQPVWLRLPDPMYFTLVIPVEQYKAQRAQWDSLVSSIKDRKACTLNVRESGNVVFIRLSGSVKEATGALKVRVENLARGDKVEGWHRAFGITGNPFVLRVYSETDAYLRPDWKRRSLKVYGMPGAIDRAREMIKGELERLASLDHTVTLARHLVGFFVREGIQQLKETLGDNNVRFTMSSRKLTVSGGEEARHAVDRLIALSHKGSHGLPNAAQGNQTCPVCYDNVSSPHQLGCGHTYCVACLRHLISSALEPDQLPLTCLGDEAQCRVPVAIPTIERFLPPASFNRLLEAAFDAYIAKYPVEFKHCKTPDCTQIYRAAQPGATPQTLHCPSCFSAVCNGCHEDAHDGLSCAESKARNPAEQERLNEAWIASQGGRVKKCPQCSVPIEKLEGCNHMTCRCGAHICWRCMGIFTAETIYAHMHASHGTIHGDVQAVPAPANINIGIPVDIEEQRELLRQAQERRIAALYDAWGRVHEEDRGERLRRQVREAEEQQRRLREQRLREQHLREQRLLREADERRRAQQAQQNRGGWGCAIM